MSFLVRVPGSCGELAQGSIDGIRLHVSCPVNRYTWAAPENESQQRRLGLKVRKALALAATFWKGDASADGLSLYSGLPVGKGMASSTADIAAALAVRQMTARSFIDLDETARLALAVEPTDGVIFEGITLFDHYRGTVRRGLGNPPSLDILAIEFEETVDTVSFNQRDYLKAAREQTRSVLAAFGLIEEGLREGCVRKIGEGATLSALAHQNLLRKPDLERILKMTLDLGGVGVNIAHSGSIVGMLFRPGTYRLGAVRRRIWNLLRRPLPIHPLQLRGGGIEVGRAGGEIE
ncbi:MAG: GHMP kinase [Candidatus Manganitrophaceae bacterium]|nr:MAG: GHMP kinase [Candidatus Manganitrophaceae bacterium]